MEEGRLVEWKKNEGDKVSTGDVLAEVETDKAVMELVARAEGVSAEVIDLRSVRPLDSDLVADSVRKTGRLVIADTGHRTLGVSGELAARISEACFGQMKAPIRRVALPDVPTPCSPALERTYYPGAPDIAAAVRSTLGAHGAGEQRTGSTDGREFHGPF
jgi:pyruvate dehydrogenase E1 component beta subunit